VWPAAFAAIAFACFWQLGRAVGHGPDPSGLLTLEVALTDRSTLIAWWLTCCGYPYVLVPVCLALIVVALRSPQWRARVGFAIFSLLISWRGADLFQHLFARPRRLDWVVKHETAYSYPSSHAAIAIGFYLVLAAFVACSRLRYRALGATLLVLLVGGILWSRLALGAHYVTDLLGGALWGVAAAGALAALAPINVFGLPEERS
jgi:undecaprenyl-diphosphatase